MISAAAMTVATMAAIVKWASEAFSVELLMLLRWGLALILFALMWRFKDRISLATEHPWLQLLNALVYVGAVYCLYLSLQTTSLPEALLLYNLAPILAPMWNRLLLGRREPPLIWLGIALGFAGVLVVMLPGMGSLGGVPWLALASGVLMSLTMLLNGMLAKTEPKERTSFYSLLFGCGVCVLGVLITGVHFPDWQHSLFPPRDWARPLIMYPWVLSALLALGVFSLLVPLLNTGAYRYGSVGELGPFRYLGVIFAGVLDWAVWGVVPALTNLGGFLLIACGGTVVILVRKPKPAPPPKRGGALQEGLVCTWSPQLCDPGQEKG